MLIQIYIGFLYLIVLSNADQNVPSVLLCRRNYKAYLLGYAHTCAGKITPTEGIAPCKCEDENKIPLCINSDRCVYPNSKECTPFACSLYRPIALSGISDCETEVGIEMLSYQNDDLSVVVCSRDYKAYFEGYVRTCAGEKTPTIGLAPCQCEDKNKILLCINSDKCVDPKSEECKPATCGVTKANTEKPKKKNCT